MSVLQQVPGRHRADGPVHLLALPNPRQAANRLRQAAVQVVPRLLDITASIFVGPLVFLVGFLVIKTFIEQRWGLFVATCLAGACVCWFAFVVIRDCIAGFERRESSWEPSRTKPTEMLMARTGFTSSTADERTPSGLTEGLTTPASTADTSPNTRGWGPGRRRRSTRL